MKNKIKLILNITVLGDSVVNQVSRTGIFRVIENTLFEMAVSEEMDILLFPGKMKYWECLKYYQMHAQLHRFKLYSPKYNIIDVIFGKYLEKISLLIKNCKIRLLRLILKSIRKLLRLSFWIYERISSIWEYQRQKLLFREYDIFHSVFYPIPEIVRKIKSIKRFTTIFDVIPLLYPNYFVNGNKHPINQIVSRLASNDYIFCISKATKDDLCVYNTKINPSNTNVTYLAASDIFHVEKDEYKINTMKQKYGIPWNCKYVLSLSTLEPRKNINLTIKSFIQVISGNDVDDLCLVLAGAVGWEYESVMNDLDKSSRYRNRIILTGYIEDGDLAALFSSAMVFVYPSFYEGFGLPPLEAMQCGTPVITSNTSSLPEVVGNAGIMIDPNDQDGLCENILQLYHDPRLRNELSGKSLQRAKEFSWEKCADAMITAYRKAINN